MTFVPKSPDNHYWLPPDAGANLQLNTTKAPFNNLEFRKAMSDGHRPRDAGRYRDLRADHAGASIPIGEGHVLQGLDR